MPKWFKKEEEIIDYTDRGKNIPEIKTGYKVTKDGFIEFNDNSQNNITPDLNNQLKPSSESSAFDFLNDFAINATDNSNNTDEKLNNAGLGNEDISDLKKTVRNVSSMAEQNSVELYKLLQRIEAIERKINSN